MREEVAGKSWASWGDGVSDNFRLPVVEILSLEKYKAEDVDGFGEL